MEIPTQENLVGARYCTQCSFQDSHSLSKENQVSLLKIFLSRPESDGRSADVWAAGVESGILAKTGPYQVKHSWHGLAPKISLSTISVMADVMSWLNQPRSATLGYQSVDGNPLNLRWAILGSST